MKRLKRQDVSHLVLSIPLRGGEALRADFTLCEGVSERLACHLNPT